MKSETKALLREVGKTATGIALMIGINVVAKVVVDKVAKPVTTDCINKLMNKIWEGNCGEKSKADYFDNIEKKETA
jgi:hypothetical protein